MKTTEVHKQKEYSIFQIASNLVMACFCAGAILALVYYLTNPIAIKNAAIVETNKMKALVADADKFVPFAEDQGKEKWFKAEKGDQLVAYVLQKEGNGFGGPITIMVGINPDYTILGYSILDHKETPGLGDKAGMSPFKDQFLGKIEDNLVVTKDPSDKEHIEAMTGATITSRAVTKIVKDSVDELKQVTGGK